MNRKWHVVLGNTLVGVTLLAGLTLAAGCGQQNSPAVPTTSQVAVDLTEAGLKNGTYELPDIGIVQLKDGTFENKYGDGATQVNRAGFGTATIADLNGDGTKEAAVVLWWSGGGSGTFWDLVVVGSQDGKPRQIGVDFLGDRTKVDSLTAANGQILVEMAAFGPNDPKCCPSQRAKRAYRLDGNTLKKVSETQTVAVPGTLTDTALKNARYELPQVDNFQLQEGSYEKKYGDGATQVHKVGFESAVFGDLNGDGVLDAAVVLWYNGGGSGTFRYLVAVVNRDGGPQQMASVLLGDRVKIQTTSIVDGRIVVDMSESGANGPQAIPTQPAIRTYRLEGGMLRQLVEGQTGPTPKPSEPARVNPTPTVPTAAADLSAIKFNPDTHQCVNTPKLILTDRTWQSYVAPKNGMGGDPITVGQEFSLNLRNKFGGSQEQYDLRASVVWPDGSTASAKVKMTGADWAVTNFPSDFGNAKPVAPGTYAVVWQATDGMVNCAGFVVKASGS